MLLTSSGLSSRALREAFSSSLPKAAGRCRAAVFAFVDNPANLPYAQAAVREVEACGVSRVDLLDFSAPNFRAPTEGYDAAYVCGGNTFEILAAMRRTGLDSWLKAHIAAGESYVGVSAGSIIPGPSIELAGWGSEGDPNNIGLQDLEGFGAAPFAVFPHYHAGLAGELAGFRKRVAYRIIELADGQGAVWDGETAEIVG